MQIVEDGPALVTKSSLQMESSSPRAARPGSREKRSREGPAGAPWSQSLYGQDQKKLKLSGYLLLQS